MISSTAVILSKATVIPSVVVILSKATVIPSKTAVILSKAKDLCTSAPGGAQNPHNKKAQPEGYAIKSIIT